MALIESFKKQGDFLFRFRSYMPLLLVIAGLSFYFFQLNTGQYIYKPSFFWVCFAVSFFGLFIRSITIGFTPKNTSGRNTRKQVADVVNTTAMYSIVRHPLYLRNFFMWLGLALISANVWFVFVFTLVFWIYYERIMYAEEFFLRDKFGSAYLEWANNVPSFIPRFSGWKSSHLSFSFKKVVKRETLGLFKLVLCFFLFQLIYECYAANCHLNEISKHGKIWLYFFIGMFVLYIIVRTLNKKTKFFKEEGR